MAKQSDLMSKWIEVRSSKGSQQKKPSECSTFSELYDKATEAGQNAAVADDKCKKQLRDLGQAEKALTVAQAALATAIGSGNVATITAASMAVSSAVSARDDKKSDYEAASSALDKALAAQKDATANMVSHRNSCPTCLR